MGLEKKIVWAEKNYEGWVESRDLHSKQMCEILQHAAGKIKSTLHHVR